MVPGTHLKGDMSMASVCVDHNMVIFGREDIPMFDEADGDSGFYPSDFSFSSHDHTDWRTNGAPAGRTHVAHSTGLHDDFAGLDAFLSGTDESAMDDALFELAGVTPHEDHNFHTDDVPGPLLGTPSPADGDYVENRVEPPQAYHKAEVDSAPNRPLIPSSSSSTCLVTTVDEQHDWKDASPNSGSQSAGCCDCGDTHCPEAGMKEPAAVLSRSGSRKLSRFSREPSSRMHSVQSVSSDKSGTLCHSEVFSTITQQCDSNIGDTAEEVGEEIWRRRGADIEFQMDLEDTVPEHVQLDSNHHSFDFYLDNPEVLGNAPRPISPAPAHMFHPQEQELKQQEEEGAQLPYHCYSAGVRPPYVSNGLRKTYSVDRDLSHHSNRQSPPEAGRLVQSFLKREYQHCAWSYDEHPDRRFAHSSPQLGSSQSLPSRSAASIAATRPKQAALRHSWSESALHSGPRWGPTTSPNLHNYPWLLERPAYTYSNSSGGNGPTGSSNGTAPSQHSPPGLTGLNSTKLHRPGSWSSASSHVKAQIQSYTQSKMSHQREEEQSRIVTSAPFVNGNSGGPISSPPGPQISALALISRVAAGMSIPGVSPSSEPTRNAEMSLASSVSLSFSKFNSAAGAQNLQSAGAGTGNSGDVNAEQLDGGLRLVQILVSCAEAVACRDSHQASSLLQTLKQLASPHGDAMQRVAACFMEGLRVRIHSSPAGFKSQSSTSSRVALPSGRNLLRSEAAHRVKPGPTERDRQDAFALMCQACPYVGFGHYVANTAILEALAGLDKLHIIDLGMAHGLQWPELISSLASRAGGKPTSLRITGVGLSAHKLAQAGEQLERAAQEAGIAFSFEAVTSSLENVTEADLGLRDGEALAVNSVLQLHCVVKESRGSLNSVLKKIHLLSPKILTLVEQDASHNGPFFMGRFVEALHYYSAIFDSLDAILPRYSTQRVKIEQFHFAEEIRNIVSCEGPARVERHERIDQWRRRMSRAGFQPLPLKFIAQARRWLTSYDCPSYTLADEKGCLVLGWNSKPIIAASSWRC